MLPGILTLSIRTSLSERWLGMEEVKASREPFLVLAVANFRVVTGFSIKEEILFQIYVVNQP